jgi:pyridoxal phosphate enzyme (YggS family)
MSIPLNIADVRSRIATATRRAGRQPEEVVLMAVSKTHPAERIRAAYAGGIRVFGENRVQEFAAKAESLLGLPDAEWHMIGHLQSNKASKAAELFGAVDSLDSVKLADRLNAAAENENKKIPVLIEMNVGGEKSKSGVAPESLDVEDLLLAAPRFGALEFRGLMTVPPFSDDADGARPYFRRLREIRDTIARRKLPGISMDVLSMGMSHDFEVAVEEGSTCVRVGTAIFGERPIPL